MRVTCPKCGGPHPGWECRVPKIVPRVVDVSYWKYERDKAEAERRITQAAEVAGPVVAQMTSAKLYAPHGQCGYCDARREAARLGMKRSRDKRKP